MLKPLIGFILLGLASITGVGCGQHSTPVTGSMGAENPPPPRVEADAEGRVVATFDAMPEATSASIGALSTQVVVNEVTLNEAQQLQSFSMLGEIPPETLESIRALTDEVLVTGFSVDDDGVLIGFSYQLPEDAGIEDGFDAVVESLTFGPGGRVESWVDADTAHEH